LYLTPTKLADDLISSTGRRRRNSPQYLKEWWQSHPERYLLAAAKQRAKKKGLEFDLKEEDIQIPEECPILHVKLNPVHFSKHHKEYSPCLDRIDNNRGYVKGNVAVISFAANRLKSNMNKEVLERLLEYVSSAN
jgi:hypothetical protein